MYTYIHYNIHTILYTYNDIVKVINTRLRNTVM